MKSIREIGELFKKTRVKKGLTIEKVYKNTRIYPGVLKTMDNGKFEDLPGDWECAKSVPVKWRR